MGKPSRDTARGKRAVIKWAVTGPFPVLSQHCSSHFQAASWKRFLACLQMPKVPEPRQKLSGWLITKCTATNPPRAGAEPSQALFVWKLCLAPRPCTACQEWDRHSTACQAGGFLSLSLSPCLGAFGAMQYFLLWLLCSLEPCECWRK